MFIFFFYIFYYIFLGDAPHWVHRDGGVYRGCVVDPRVITLQTVIHHRTMLQIIIMIVHELRDLYLVSPHVLPQEVKPAHVP